jgi:hypothetical protein
MINVDDSTYVWPAGGPWQRWQKSRDLQRRREFWIAGFLAEEVAMRPDMVAKCELGQPPLALRASPTDEGGMSHRQHLLGAWLAMKVCARRLPTDPIAVGLGVFEGLRTHVETIGQADETRRTAGDKAPDGGRWHRWAMTNPGLNISEEEAIRRDMAAGGAAALIEHIDQAANTYRRAMRTLRWRAWMTHFLPLFALACVITILEIDISRGPWLALIVGILVFVVVDWVIVQHVVEPLIELKQRKIIDRTANELSDIGLAVIAGGLARRNRADQAP